MKVAVVTGGNKGIGFAIARGLCQKFDGTVYLTARDETRGLKAIEELKKNGLNPKFHQLDIDNLESIKRFQDYIKEKYGGLDVLVNNAAIAYKVNRYWYKKTSTFFFLKQYYTTISYLMSRMKNYSRSVNEAGLMLLKMLHEKQLKDKMNAVSASGEYVTRVLQHPVELSEGDIADSDNDPDIHIFNDPNMNLELETESDEDVSAKKNTHSEEGWGNSAYVVSKVGVSALTFIQQRKFDCDERPDLVVNAVHPGYVDTDMTSHTGPLTIEEGAVAPLHCALLPPGVKSPRGKYIWCDKKEVDWISGPVPSQH
ncbi:carbonyl reductase [NADPH] 3-like [Schistocerca gregaria]|uniref:carbonyl reductase [NADPH] 3-like n=1 Tax=Schistocerca gregaria TaxID=7010 RepID=UPI00211E6369|nr:carbonyl reductase [NADPH] 3-like [Schistocerca gregaria]